MNNRPYKSDDQLFKENLLLTELCKTVGIWLIFLTLYMKFGY